MSFDHTEGIMEVATKLLVQAQMDPLIRADVLSILRARLHYGFRAGHCAVCGRIARLELPTNDKLDDPPDLPLDQAVHCDCGAYAPIGRWSVERFGRDD